MKRVERGRVHDGGIVFSEPLTIPDGTEVAVEIEPLTEGGQPTEPAEAASFASLPFFGIWADREEFDDSAAWVRREREKWQQRAARSD